MKMKAEVWTEKYRPRTFKQIIGHRKMAKKLENLTNGVINETGAMPNLLFYGPTGNGKTTMARIVMKALLGDAKPLILNASKDRGIDFVRNQVAEYAKHGAISDIPFKIIYMDECDQITKTAQAALRAIMEDHTDKVRFILSCENVTKIIPAIRGRTGKLFFPPVDYDDINDYLLKITLGEHLKITKTALMAIAKKSNGNVREAVNNLSLICQMMPQGVKSGDVEETFGLKQDHLAEELLNKAHGGAINKSYFEAVASGLLPTGLFNFIIKDLEKKDIEPKQKCDIIRMVSEIDHRVNMGGHPDIHVRALLYWYVSGGWFK